MGLGNADHVSLAEARDQADAAHKLLAQGIDPIDHRLAAKAAAIAEAEAAKPVVTFDDAAERYITTHEAGWRNPKHRAQWRATLADICRTADRRDASGGYRHG